MERYKIYEGNMERLEKKLTRIFNKCKKYGIFFHYKKVGEEFEEKENDCGEKYFLKYIIVEAEGNAVINDWEFIATLEYTGSGNLIKGYGESEIPEKYYTCEPVCEHCKTNHYRKNTYIIKNTNTGEFKQVGKNCLADFTGGLSAEAVAQYISCYDELIQGEEPYAGYRTEKYIDIDTALCYAGETVKKFGYVKADNIGATSTKEKVLNYYSCKYDYSMISSIDKKIKLKREMESVNFNPNSEEIKTLAEDVRTWILNHEDNSNYFHNLKVVCNTEYVKYTDLGILASIFPTYNRWLEIEREREKIRKNDAGSEHVGNIGDRILIDVDNSQMVSSYETQWGYTMIYKIYGTDGNVYIWRSSTGMGRDITKVKKIKGTIKAHSEYNGIKQTELTRCKVID